MAKFYYGDSDNKAKEVKLTLETTPGGDNNVIPVGGTTGQVLSKIDDINYNVEWSSIPKYWNEYLLNSGNGITVLEPKDSNDTWLIGHRSYDGSGCFIRGGVSSTDRVSISSSLAVSEIEGEKFKYSTGQTKDFVIRTLEGTGNSRPSIFMSNDYGIRIWLAHGAKPEVGQVLIASDNIGTLEWGDVPKELPHLIEEYNEEDKSVTLRSITPVKGRSYIQLDTDKLSIGTINTPSISLGNVLCIKDNISSHTAGQVLTLNNPETGEAHWADLGENDPLSIHLNGTSTTTAQIPFAKGISAAGPSTFTDTVTVPAPTKNEHAVNKQYVDSNFPLSPTIRNIQVVSALPSSPDPSTLYLIQG